jgi:3-hydroxymyristoyl/3-hydroxydecanoyl-(acyl carrier protein) dehydratase
MNYIEIRKDLQLNRPLSFAPELDIFTHHFPTNPLLPGALSGVLLAEICGGQEWSLRKITGLRFRKPLIPDLSVSFSCNVIEESSTEKTCAGKILSGTDTIADGEFAFSKSPLSLAAGSAPETKTGFWNSTQIRQYLPHGEPIVLIDQLVEVNYPAEIQDYLSGKSDAGIDQTKLVGTKIHTRSTLKPNNFWLDDKVLPSSVLSELVAQAGALTLAPFFTGAKPEVALLGCDTEFFAQAKEGDTIDTYLELTRAKRLGKTANMIIFKSECFVGTTKIAQVSLNAMATF